jgi:hypothetical protein
MKRLIVAGSVMAPMTGGAGAVLAEPARNGNNTFGLCTTYFAGNDTAREHKRTALRGADQGRQGQRPVG